MQNDASDWLRSFRSYFLPALTFAHLARCAAAILLLPAAEILCLAGADPVDFATTVGCVFRRLAHRAFCASAILRREAADMIRFGRLVPVPFKDSIAEIIWFNCSNRNSVALRSLRSS
jgi:hypothetical protein